jgi:hypothetical protein
MVCKRISIKDTRGFIDLSCRSIDKAPTKVIPFFDFVVLQNFRVLLDFLDHATRTNVLANGKKS